MAELPDGRPASGATGLLSALDGAGGEHPVSTFAADTTGAFHVPVPATDELFGYAAETGGRLYLVVALSTTAAPLPGAAPVVYRAAGAAETAPWEIAGEREFASPAPDTYVLARTDTPRTTAPGPIEVNVSRAAKSKTRTYCRRYAWRANCPVNKNGAYGWQTMAIQDVVEQMYHWDPYCYVSPGTIDGYFGGDTEFAVQYYQACQKLVADGVVGYDTWGYFWDQAERKGLEHRVKRADGDGYCWSQNGSTICIKDSHCTPSFGGADNFVDVNPYNTRIYGWQQHRVGDSSNGNDERWTVLDNRNGRVGGCHYMVDDFS